MSDVFTWHTGIARIPEHWSCLVSQCLCNLKSENRLCIFHLFAEVLRYFIFKGSVHTHFVTHVCNPSILPCFRPGFSSLRSVSALVFLGVNVTLFVVLVLKYYITLDNSQVFLHVPNYSWRLILTQLKPEVSKLHYNYLHGQKPVEYLLSCYHRKPMITLIIAHITAVLISTCKIYIYSEKDNLSYHLKASLFHTDGQSTKAPICSLQGTNTKLVLLTYNIVL